MKITVYFLINSQNPENLGSNRFRLNPIIGTSPLHRPTRLIETAGLFGL